MNVHSDVLKISASIVQGAIKTHDINPDKVNPAVS